MLSTWRLGRAFVGSARNAGRVNSGLLRHAGSTQGVLEDVSTWRPSEMRRYLDERGIRHNDCFEKSELIARVEDAVAKNLPPKAAQDPEPSATTASATDPGCRLYSRAFMVAFWRSGLTAWSLGSGFWSSSCEAVLKDFLIASIELRDAAGRFAHFGELVELPSRARFFSALTVLLQLGSAMQALKHLRKEDGVFIFLHGFGDSGRGFVSQLPNLLSLPSVRYVLPTAPSLSGMRSWFTTAAMMGGASVQVYLLKRGSGVLGIVHLV
eukprot:s1222_g10.t2